MMAHSNIFLESEEPKEIYSADQLSLLDLKKGPRHVAVIMDGNRRWARQKKLPPMAIGRGRRCWFRSFALLPN
jgi:undecaprenyl pyrophosphate synthase